MMKKKIALGWLCVLMVLSMTACKSGTQSASEAESVSTPVDIVSQIKDLVTSEISVTMSTKQKSSYTILLDGWSDSAAGYYLYDLTGDAVPELIVGSDMMTVYSYNEDSVLTIGTLMGSVLYLSDSYGLVTRYEGNGNYELRRYRFNGELLSETVLLSVSDLDNFEVRSVNYLGDATELEAYALSNRTPFE